MLPRFKNHAGLNDWLLQAGLEPNFLPEDAVFRFQHEGRAGNRRVWLTTEVLTGRVLDGADEGERREIHIRLV